VAGLNYAIFVWELHLMVVDLKPGPSRLKHVATLSLYSLFVLSSVRNPGQAMPTFEVEVDIRNPSDPSHNVHKPACSHRTGIS
jgi:hypothetical protein